HAQTHIDPPRRSLRLMPAIAEHKPLALAWIIRDLDIDRPRPPPKLDVKAPSSEPGLLGWLVRGCLYGWGIRDDREHVRKLRFHRLRGIGHGLLCSGNELAPRRTR